MEIIDDKLNDKIDIRLIVEFIILEIVRFGWQYYHKQMHNIFYKIKKHSIINGIECLQFRENHVYPISDLVDEIYDELKICNLVQVSSSGMLCARQNRDEIYAEAIDTIYQINPDIEKEIEKIIIEVVNEK